MPGNKGDKSWAVRSLQTSLCAKYANTARFRMFCPDYAKDSPHPGLYGGEAGIRTLGTGVSPYNGLANSPRPLPIARNQPVTTISGVVSRAESGCSGDVYAPEYAPLLTGFTSRTETRASRLVICSVSELRPHPSYSRHNLSVQPAKLAALAELGELGFLHPISITREKSIIDGYARWELAKQKGRPTLNCIEYDLTAEEALQELVRTHRRSQGLSDFVRIELALDLTSYFEDKALLNRRNGGRLKGLSRLTTAEKVNLRTEIARVARVSVGNVHKVKYILAHGCSALKEAVRTGEVSINRADKWSHELDVRQHEFLRLSRIERGIRRKARHLAADLARTAAPNSDEQLIRLPDLVGIVNQLTAIPPERSKEFTFVSLKLVDGYGRAILVTEELIRALTPQQQVAR